MGIRVLKIIIKIIKIYKKIKKEYINKEYSKK